MNIRTVETRYYEYNQNNSGGTWQQPGINVYVEARSADEADIRAGEIGIEFGTGCPCCGDRWDSAREHYSFAEIPPRDEYSGFYDGQVEYDGKTRVPNRVKFDYGETVAVEVP